MTKKTKLALIAFIIIFLIILAYQLFLKDKNNGFVLTEVTIGDIHQEIFENGQVLKGERINLSFKVGGRIEEIYVRSGDEISSGEYLARLDSTSLGFQLEEAMASLELAKLNLNKLLIGATPEETRIAQNQFESVRVSFDTEKENLENSYQSSLTVLDGAYPQTYNSFDFSRNFVNDYIVIYDQESRKILDARDLIERSEKNARENLEKAKQSLKNEEIEQALLIMENSLRNTFDSLEVIRYTVENSDIYKDKVLLADKGSLESLKVSVNNFLNQVIGSRQNISLMKLNLESAEKSFSEAEERLAIVKGEAKAIDVSLYQTQIKQAQARVNLYQNELNNSRLVSPINGKVIEVKKRPGELVQPSFQDVVLIILPIVPYEVKVDIYEEEIVKINLNNPVRISLPAFPGETFRGKVIEISPAEKIIHEVVYYQVTVGFEEFPEEIRPGMTADLTIETNSKENVLVISRDAFRRRSDKKIVEVFKNGTIEEREIEIGLIGSENMVEVILGLKEGEKVILRR